MWNKNFSIHWTVVYKFDIFFKMSMKWGSFDSGTNAFTSIIHPCAIYSNLNSSPPSAPYMRLWTGSTLVQIMACRLLGTKPLPQPMIHFANWTNSNEIRIKIQNFHSRKWIWKWRQFCLGLIVFTNCFYLCPSNAPLFATMILSCWGGSWEIMGICGKHRCVE